MKSPFYRGLGLLGTCALPLSTLPTQAADLVATAFSFTGEPVAERSVQLSWTVENGGGATVPSGWYDRIYFSTNDTWETTDSMEVSQYVSLALTPGSNYTRSANLTLPDVPEGRCWLILRVDSSHAITETNESNNELIIPIDIVVSDLQPTPGSLAFTGEPVIERSVEVSWGGENHGSGTAKPAWYDRIYFSTNDTWEATDSMKVSQYVSLALAPGGNYTRSASFTLPNVPEGRYWLILRVDSSDAITETNESNNELIIPIDIVISDLQPTPGSLSFSGEPVIEHSVQVSWGGENHGSGTAKPAWYDRIYFSTNDTWEATDSMEVSQYVSLALAPGGNYTRSASFTLPNVPEGRYWLILRVDSSDAITETNESNNELVIPIDIVISDLQPTPGSLSFSGEAVIEHSVQVSWGGENHGRGTAKPAWYDRIYFSTNDTWEVTDSMEVSQYVSLTLAPGSNYTRSASFTLPNVPEGRYWLILRVDSSDAIAETNESNNELIIPIDIVISDLQPTPGSLSFTGEPIADRSVQVSWGGENHGSGTAKPAWYDRIYFSTNNTWEATDSMEVSQYVSLALAPGSNYTRSASFTLPEVPEGRYWLILHVDSSDGITETNESNNELIIPINVVVPDLAITNFRLLSGGLAEGSARVGWTITNQGSGTAKSSWYDRLYFSANEVWDGDDLRLANSYEPRTLAPGASYGRTNTYTLPDTPSGSAYLILRSDSSGAVFEITEANNTAVLPLGDATLRPRLSIRWAPPNVVVYWPTSAVGFTLESAPNLGSSAVWTTPPDPVVTSGTNFQVTVAPGESSRFFRLMSE